jgi:hypothetical protein
MDSAGGLVVEERMLGAWLRAVSEASVWGDEDWREEPRDADCGVVDMEWMRSASEIEADCLSIDHSVLEIRGIHTCGLWGCKEVNMLLLNLGDFQE